MQPTIGRIVDFHHQDGRTCPAIVTETGPTPLGGPLALTVFTIFGVQVHVDASEGTEVGQWSWPSRGAT